MTDEGKMSEQIGAWKVHSITKGMCSDAQIVDEQGRGIAIVEGGNWGREDIDDETLEKHARLIASAPDMADATLSKMQTKTAPVVAEHK